MIHSEVHGGVCKFFNQMTKTPTKYQKTLQSCVEMIPYEQSQQAKSIPGIALLLEKITADKAVCKPLRGCTEEDIKDILGLDTTEVSGNNRKVWILPEGVQKRSPSNQVKPILALLSKYWKPNSENTTRTLIDMVILDVIDHGQDDIGPKNPLLVYGEVHCEFTDHDKNLGFNEFCDYGLGYDIKRGGVTIGIEAKKLDEKMDIWQIIGYVGILHKYRVAKSDSNITTCYGVVTDSSLWQFVKIDDTGKIFTSRKIDCTQNWIEIWTWMNYILQNARRISATSTPASSLEHISKGNFSVVVESFAVDSGTNVDDDDESNDQELAGMLADFMKLSE
jgi:hypothetical protein